MASGDATPMYSFPQWYPLNQPSMMMNCHRIQMSRKKHRKRRKKTCFCYSSELGSRSTCNTIIALSFFLILIIVITIAALAIYIGMEIILDGSLRVTYGDYYTTELYNRTSQLFLSKAHIYKIMIEKVFAKSILGPSLKQCFIMGFKNGSLIIFYRLILDRRKIPSRTYVNIEETAKKILYDEITSLKPTVFSNIRLDPKQIVLRKHSLSTDLREKPDEAEPITEDATISNLNPGVLKRLGHTTPSLVRKRLPTQATLPPTVSSQQPTRTKVTKKPRTPTVEKTTKTKPHVDSSRFSSSSTNSVPKKQSNWDVNGNTNRYSFVSDDNQQVNALTATTNATQGFGEVEVILLPTTADGESASKNSPGTTPRIHERAKSSLISAFSQPVVEKRMNLPTSLPTRSNIALSRPLRPKPVVSSETSAPNTEPTPPNVVTEDPVIVLNTEVVTSTSVQVSYGQGTELDTIASPPEVVQLTKQASSNQPPKYKNIFPRSIRDVNSQSETLKNLTLHSIIEKYRKQPSNESLLLVLEQLALMYTKSPVKTSSSLVDKWATGTSKGYDGVLLTRPMNRVSTSAVPTTTTRITTPSSLCQENATKQCNNGQCISEHLWCNQFADCNDGSDEKNCTCADYLRTQFSFKKICDGIVDCWDFSDENLCEWCTPDMYVCTNEKLCIEEDKVCDGIRDCPLGDDEKNCITITQFQPNNRSDVVYQSTGVITVKRAGVWGKLCFKEEENHSTEKTMDKLSELGKAVCKTMTFRDFTNLTIIRDDDNEPASVYYKLTNVVRNNTNPLLRRKNFKFAKTDCQNKQIVQISCDNLECGIQTQIGKGRAHGKYRGERRSRIVGGGSATLGAWPWQAALYKEGEFQCGATLISNKWLLSAGHCFNNALREYWVARLGILRRSSTLPSPHEQIRPIQRIFVHPHYADADFLNDISLLEMSTEVHITNFVRPICLPNPNSNLPDGTLCTVIGWGQMMESGSVYPDTLQEVQLPVMSPAECRKRTVFLPLYKITDGMLCAGFDRGGRDACLGDSGGPLMCHDNDDSWHLYGVTSNGNGCARAHRPGVYTKVTNYLNWIDNYLKNTTSAYNNSGHKIIAPVCNGFRCPLGECLPKARICNGYMECSDGSDEFAC